MDESEVEYYHKADLKALQIRIDYRMFEKNIDILLLCKKMGLVLVKYSSLDCVTLTKIKDIYGQNDGLEIGHFTDTNHLSQEYEEKVADHFARSLLVPRCVLIYEKYNDPYKVANDFNVSLSAATYALNSAIKWKNHPNFKFSEKEIEYLQLYKDYIKTK